MNSTGAFIVVALAACLLAASQPALGDPAARLQEELVQDQVELGRVQIVKLLNLLDPEDAGDVEYIQLLDAVQDLANYDESKCTPEAFDAMNSLAEHYQKTYNNIGEYIGFHMGQQVKLCEPVFVKLLHHDLTLMPRDAKLSLEKLDELREILHQHVPLSDPMDEAGLTSVHEYLQRGNLEDPVWAQGLANYIVAKDLKGSRYDFRVSTKIKSAIRKHFAPSLEAVKQHLTSVLPLYQQMAKFAGMAFEYYNDEAADWTINLLIFEKLDQPNPTNAMKKSDLYSKKISLTNKLTGCFGDICSVPASKDSIAVKDHVNSME